MPDIIENNYSFRMKPKITLISVSINYNYLLTKYYYKLPSLGIGYIAAVLEQNGYKVNIIDRMMSPHELDVFVDEIVKSNSDIVGFYCISETFKTVMQIIRMIKERNPGIITVIGGPHVYGLPQQGINYDYVDFAFWGEAEDSFLQFLDCNFSSAEFKNIPGLIYKNNGKITINPMALVNDLDTLPFPARHLYPPMKLYRPSILAYKRLPATGMITSRGCTYRCIFCHSGKGHFKLRLHSAEYVIDEIKNLKKNFGINEIIFFDDTFLIHQERAVQICEGIIKEGINISWSCNARVNNLNKNLLKLLKRAGCWLIQVGVESGNQDILNAIKKGITLEQVEKACRLACDMGLEVKTYFILGHPGENIETLNDTIKFMTGLPAHYASINFMTPLPGTELWDVVDKFGYFDKEKLEAINYLSDKPAFIPYGLSEEILVSKFKEAYLKFYLNPKTILRQIKTLRTVEDFKKIFFASVILSEFILSRLQKKKG